MKSRLSSTIWMLVLATGTALLTVLWLAYSAGRQSGGAAIFESNPGTSLVIFAALVALCAAALLAWQLSSHFVAPVTELAEFSERLAAGDPRARVQVNSNDELGYIA
jgi:HAMP domain-containing protein